MASLLGGNDDGWCKVLGEACLSGGEDRSEYGRELFEDANGEGKLGAPETEVDIDGGKVDVGALVPITSCIDGNDCLGGSCCSSACLRGSTGDMIPGMLEPVFWCE